MKPNAPWIDPVEHGLESQLHAGSFHIVYLMNEKTDEFDLVTPDEFKLAHGQFNSKHTTNMLAISVEKSDVEGITPEGRVQTQAIPRTKIAVDSIFVSVDSLAEKAKLAVGEYFDFV